MLKKPAISLKKSIKLFVSHITFEYSREKHYSFLERSDCIRFYISRVIVIKDLHHYCQLDISFIIIAFFIKGT